MERVKVPTEVQESPQIQQQLDHQVHWEKTVQVTPETVVVEELEAEESMAVQVETVDLMTVEVPAVDQDRT